MWLVVVEQLRTSASAAICKQYCISFICLCLQMLEADNVCLCCCQSYCFHSCRKPWSACTSEWCILWECQRYGTESSVRLYVCLLRCMSLVHVLILGVASSCTPWLLVLHKILEHSFRAQLLPT